MLSTNNFIDMYLHGKTLVLFSILYVALVLSVPEYCVAQNQSKTLTPEMLSMPRSKMFLEDDQLLLFNGIGAASPCELSITGVTNLKFTPTVFPNYNFHFNFFDNSSGTLIHDDAKFIESLYLEKGIGFDPNGANLRPGFAKMLIPQDDIWQPNQSYRKGIFHNKLKEKWVSFGIESWTSVSGSKDEVLQKIRIVNRSLEKMDITLIPNQQIMHKISETNNFPEGNIGTYEIISGRTQICIASDVPETDDKGFRIKLPAHGTGEFYFAIQLLNISEKEAGINRYQPDIKGRYARAEQRTRERLQLTADRLPTCHTDNKQINELYKRCLLSVSECKWERDDFVVKPFWASGEWIISMIWDQVFAKEVLAMIDPEGLKEAIKLTLRECNMKESYIGWNGVYKGSPLYIQDPIALQKMIVAYVTYTGDKSIMDETTGDATVYEWMKRWVYLLHDDYGRPDGLLDIEDPEHLIEIRTGGYNRVVPVVSGLAADFYKRMSEWASERGDNDASKFRKWSEQTLESLINKAWNDELGWFDNLYPDGGRASTMTFHLYDLLEVEMIGTFQKARMIEHLRDGEFMAPYGLYSISKTDSMHWDRMDADFGGGGQYTGMTLQIAKNLYLNGYPGKAYEVLKRFSQYTEHFPYMPGNPWSDKMYQNSVSLCLQISSGSGIEAIISGIFGIRTKENGSIEFNPSYNLELGNSELYDFQFRGDSYDVILKPDYYLLKKNGVQIAINKYGTQLTL